MEQNNNDDTELYFNLKYLPNILECIKIVDLVMLWYAQPFDLRIIGKFQDICLGNGYLR